MNRRQLDSLIAAEPAALAGPARLAALAAFAGFASVEWTEYFRETSNRPLWLPLFQNLTYCHLLILALKLAILFQ